MRLQKIPFTVVLALHSVEFRGDRERDGHLRKNRLKGLYAAVGPRGRLGRVARQRGAVFALRRTVQPVRKLVAEIDVQNRIVQAGAFDLAQQVDPDLREVLRRFQLRNVRIAFLVPEPARKADQNAVLLADAQKFEQIFEHIRDRNRLCRAPAARLPDRVERKAARIAERDQLGIGIDAHGVVAALDKL